MENPHTAEYSDQDRPLTRIFEGNIIMPHHGLVAQLGERTVRIRKVEGSIPFESTNQKATPSGVVFLFTTKGIESRHLATVRWTVATGVAFPQKSDPLRVHQSEGHPTGVVFLIVAIFLFV